MSVQTRNYLRNLNDLFKSFPLSTFSKPKEEKFETITVQSNDSLRSVLNLMASLKISSVPVMVEGVSRDEVWTEKYLGLLDLADIVVYLCNSVEENKRNMKALDESEEDWMNFFTATPSLRRLVDASTAGTECHRFGLSPFVPILDDASTTAYDAMLMLGKFKCHRVYVVDLIGDIKTVVSQTDVIRLLYKCVVTLIHITYY